MDRPDAERWAALLGALEHGLLERQTAARALLLAALAGEHVLLIGPPGTAKSQLARRLHRAVDVAGYFERLLTRFSTPEELFGPLSLKALEDDRYERLIAGFLPTAGVAFLDEVFKANSAILNALLTLLNEREFDNGSGRQRTPLLSVVGASNEVPTDEALLAFFDRFLLRVPVAPVSDASFAALLTLDEAPPASVAPLAAAERQAVLRAAARVVLGEPAVAACAALRGWLAARGQPLSDRRWRQWIGLMRVAAASEGRKEVDELDLWLAPFIAAATPQDMPALAQWFAVDVLAAVAHDAPWLTQAVEAFERQLQIEASATGDVQDGGAQAAGKLALARSIGRRDAGDGDGSDAAMLRIVSQALEEQLHRRYSSVHLQARLAQVDQVIAQVQGIRADVEAQRARLAERLSGRVWLPPELEQRLLGAHHHTLATLTDRLQRLQGCRDGFAGLPLQPPQEGDAAPPPIPLEAAATA